MNREEYYDILSLLFGIMLVKYQMTTSLQSKVYIKCEMICVGPNMWEMSIIKYHEEQLVRCLAACGEIKNKLHMERKWSNVLGSMGQNYYSCGIESENE